MSAVVDFPVKPETRPYLEAFGRGAFGRDQGEPDWLAGYRKGSLARFAELGFPSRRSESWRYLDLRALEQKPILPVGGKSTVGAATRAQLAEIGLAEPAYRLVLADGRFAPELSAIEELPAGVWLGSMGRARSNISRCSPTLRGAQRCVFCRRLRSRHRSRHHARSAGRDHSLVVGRERQFAAHAQPRYTR